MNESMMKLCPRSGPTFPIWLSATPARPATPDPKPKAIRSTRSVGTPIADAIARFWVTPRTKSPNRVCESSNAIMRRTASENPMMKIRFQGRAAPATVSAPDSQEGFWISTFCGPTRVRTVWIKASEMPQVASRVSSGRPYKCRMMARSSKAPTEAAAKKAMGKATSGYQSNACGAQARNAVWTPQVA